MVRKVLKSYVWAHLLAVFISLSCYSCVNERIVYVDSEGNVVGTSEDPVVDGVELEVSLSGSAEQSRVARPLGSSSSINNVNTVKVYVFSKKDDDSDNTYVFDETVGVEAGVDEDGYNISGGNGIILITGFSDPSVGDGSSDSSVDMNGSNEQSCTISLNGLMIGRVYQFVAVGYNSSAETGFSNPYGDLNVENLTIEIDVTADAETVLLNKFSTSIPKSGYNYIDGYNIEFDVEELFSGVSGEILPGTLGNNKVILNRQVAGMLGYFINIPTKVNDKVVRYLRVYADKTYKYISFPAESSSLNGTDISGMNTMGYSGYNGAESYVSGNPDDRQLLLSFDMEKIALNWEESPEKQNSSMYMFYSGEDELGFEVPASGDENADSDSGYKPPLAEGYIPPAGLKLYPNSVFGGRFIIPYNESYITDSGSTEEYSTIFIVLQDSDGNDLKKYNVFISQEESDEDTSGMPHKIYNYGILSNNFYSLGNKTLTSDNKSDKPLDLGAGSELIIIIDDSWNGTYDLIKEENEEDMK